VYIADLGRSENPGKVFDVLEVLVFGLNSIENNKKYYLYM